MSPFREGLRLLGDQENFFAEIRERKDLGKKIESLCFTAFFSFFLYGLTLGLFQDWRQALSSAVKLPALYLVTVALCTPTLYLFNRLFGSKADFREHFLVLLAGVTVTSLLLVGFVPVTFFFLISAEPSLEHYQFYKLLNTAIFVLTGLVGLRMIFREVRRLEGDEARRPTRTKLLLCWVLLYALVGSQMGWMFRPFMGAPDYDFEIFRKREGNIFIHTLHTVKDVMQK